VNQDAVTEDDDEYASPTKRGRWHAETAARLLEEQLDPDTVARAQVHALLALAWATSDRWD
jgi:hypothetical protein